MNEYQFRIRCSAWVDVHAETIDEALDTLNGALPLLDEPLPAPGPLQRVLLDVQELVEKKDIAYVYTMDGEECAPE